MDRVVVRVTRLTELGAIIDVERFDGNGAQLSLQLPLTQATPRRRWSPISPAGAARCGGWIERLHAYANRPIRARQSGVGRVVPLG